MLLRPMPQVCEHASEDGQLPDDEPEVVVTEGSSVLPEALAPKMVIAPKAVIPPLPKADDGEDGSVKPLPSFVESGFTSRVEYEAWAAPRRERIARQQQMHETRAAAQAEAEAEAEEEEEEAGEVSPAVAALRRSLEQRSAARRQRDYALADRYRDELLKIGISLDDKRNRWEGSLEGLDRRGAIEPFELYATAATLGGDGVVATDQTATDGGGAEGSEEWPLPEGKRRCPASTAETPEEIAAREAAKAEREAIVAACKEHAAVLHSYGGIRPLERVADTHKANRYPPLFVPNSELLATLRSFFGLSEAFETPRLVVRSPTVRMPPALTPCSLLKLLCRAAARPVPPPPLFAPPPLLPILPLLSLHPSTLPRLTTGAFNRSPGEVGADAFGPGPRAAAARPGGPPACRQHGRAHLRL